MQISSANLLAAQQAAQAALAAKQAARTAAAPAFALPNLEAGSKPATGKPVATAPTQAPQPGSGIRLGQHINIII